MLKTIDGVIEKCLKDHRMWEDNGNRVPSEDLGMLKSV
jgi:hypothetical protein